MQKLTFKNNKKEKGLAGISSKKSVTIKRNKNEVGVIFEQSLSSQDNLYRIKFMVKDNNSWKWVMLSYKAKSIDKAKEFVKRYNDVIQTKFNLYEIINGE